MKNTVTRVAMVGAFAAGWYTALRGTRYVAAASQERGAASERAPAASVRGSVRNRPAPARVRFAHEFREFDPLSDEYDPVALSETARASMRAVFAGEPRREAWARPMEGWIRETLGRDLAELFPEAEIESVECRTSSCEVVVNAPAELADHVYEFVQLPPLGDIVRPDLERLEEGARVSAVVAVARDHRELAAHRAWYESVRTSLEPALRARRDELRAWRASRGDR